MQHISNFAGSSILPPLSLILPFIVTLLLLLALVFLVIHFRNKHLSFAHKLKEFLVWSGFVIFGILAFAAYVFLPSPKITSVYPVADSSGVDPKSVITITFDRPIARPTMDKLITPDIPGTWIFEDPFYTTHLYRKVVFYPDTTLNAGVKYTIKIGNIQNTLKSSTPYTFIYSFETKKDPVIAKALSAVESQTVKLEVPSYLQQHTLSCEVSSLRMALAYKGVMKSEDELLSEVGIDNTPHVGNTWGNPYEAFVGNVNGNQMRDGYGVYWGPIERVAKMYGNAQAFQNGSISLLTSNILKGNPVIIWVYSSSGAPTHWKTPSGVDIFAVAGEHTVVAVGFVGKADNPTQIIVNDSLVGQVYWPRSLFNEKWDTFSQSGVIIFK